ncbi:MAG TPA: ABC transporter substrate-binding protein [Rhizomicrobium sp.]|jgi:NitT/TauT family transport system substrate-binding protein|nr:ABC transporter substrate-binding protein [Rhizomicrobium sp.]
MRFIGKIALAMCLAAAAAPAAQADRLAISEYGKITATLPWAVAFKLGYLKQDGLNITEIVSSSGGGGGLRNLLASGMAIGEVSTASAIAAINQGMDLRILMCTADRISDLTWVTMNNGPVHTIKDLAGKRAAFTAPRSTTEMVLRAAIAKAGLTGKVELLPAGGLGPGLTALGQGAVAAAPLIDAHLTSQPDKYRVLFRGNDIFPEIDHSVVVATRAFTQQHPDQVRALLRARRRAAEYMEKHPDETAMIYSRVFGFSLADARKVLPKYLAGGQFSHGEFSKKGLEAMSRGMLLVDLVKKPVAWSKIVDQSFLAPDQRRTLW